MRTDYSWSRCDWCSKVLYTDELVTKIISHVTYHLCSFCAGYDSFVDVQAEYALLIAQGYYDDNLWWI